MDKENPLYQYAISQEGNSVEADIYFDDEQEDRDIKENISYGLVRLIFSNILSSSSGSMLNLQVLLALFSGLSLREASKICKTSHENCRTILNGIKKEYPELYEVIKNQKYKIDAIVPTLKNKKYKVTDKITNKSTYYSRIKEISKKYNITANCIHQHLFRKNDNSLINRRFKIQKIQGEE